LLAAVFRVDLRVAAADLLPPAERFAFARFVVVLPRLAAAFFVVEGFLRLRGFSAVPVTASAMLVAALETPSMAASTPVLVASVMLVAALDTPSMAASMLVLAASVIVSRTPSFSSSMLFTPLSCISDEPHTESTHGSISHFEKAVQIEQ
jgi:hypothetical protein